MTRLVLTFALVLSALFAVTGTARAQTPAPEPTLQDDLPIHGGFALAVWSGGSLNSLRTEAQARGCRAVSVWVTQHGEMVGHIFDAPTIANETTGSATAFPGAQVAPGTAVIVVCAVVTAPAPIESIEIRSAGGGWSAHVVSGRPGGCVEFHGYEVSRAGDIITLRVLNRVPAEGAMIACTAIYGYVDSEIALPGPFLPGVTYTVRVNDKATTFTP